MKSPLPNNTSSFYALQLALKRWISFKKSVFLAQQPPQLVRASSFTRFLHHTQRRTTVSTTPLDGWSARRRDLYLTKHTTHNRQTSMSPLGFDPTISSGERPQKYVFDRAVTGTDNFKYESCQTWERRYKGSSEKKCENLTISEWRLESKWNDVTFCGQL